MIGGYPCGETSFNGIPRTSADRVAKMRSLGVMQPSFERVSDTSIKLIFAQDVPAGLKLRIYRADDLTNQFSLLTGNATLTAEGDNFIYTDSVDADTDYKYRAQLVLESTLHTTTGKPSEVRRAKSKNRIL